MNLTGPFSRSTRLEKSIAELEAELAGARIAPWEIANDFIDTTDADNFEERFAQLSPAMRELIERRARLNVLTFESIIEDRIRRGGYAGGWRALRDWARRQVWHAEAVARAEEVQAAQTESLEDAEAAGSRYAEQGRMLGLLRVELMRATTDQERERIREEIEELETAFQGANRGAT